MFHEFRGTVLDARPSKALCEMVTMTLNATCICTSSSYKEKLHHSYLLISLALSLSTLVVVPQELVSQLSLDF